MEGLRSRVYSILFSRERAFAYAEIFLSWETNYVIEDELIRNLIIATVVIFFITLILVANWLAAVLVLLSVALTISACVVHSSSTGGHSRITVLLGAEYQHCYCNTISSGGWFVCGLCCTCGTCVHESYRL